MYALIIALVEWIQLQHRGHCKAQDAPVAKELKQQK